ncbi:MAG: indolepyruvate ferredoxin oxidoreductase subunit alpha [Lachnospiraceae bacterium]|nr:indolepyruvate ferredoxin oxidoreductase subunit alpha [Lachnospiraceae bacterium]
MKTFLMGNEAIGLGALHAGVQVAAGYPGTPSTEVLETIAKNKPGDVYVEWSVNEKAAMEVAAAAAYTGARTMVTMKQVGLNVASDPLMSLAYVGVKGGMIVLVADDPGPISSQTEQDTRHFAQFAKLPVFDPSSPEEAYEMVEDAFAVSEKYHTPVILRSTTRVCHGCAGIQLKERQAPKKPEGFIKDANRWVIFPRLSFANHKMIEDRLPQMGNDLGLLLYNQLWGRGRKGIITGGISYEYVMEALDGFENVRVLKVGTPHPFPEELALTFLDGLTEVMAVEELDPVLEKELLTVCGKHHRNVSIKGKISGHVQRAGENTVESVKQVLKDFLKEEGFGREPEAADTKEGPACPPLPIRPPVLCAGCPHRGAFYAVKRAMEQMEGVEGVYCGDIGCYTLGNAKPLDMVDTCLCMGAGITMAQGLQRVEPDKKYFAFVGDSTFFASAITGIVNAVYNEAELTVCILDNSTTAMTGHQPHPGTGKTMMGHVVEKVDITKVLEGIGVRHIETVNPLDLSASIDVVSRMAELPGVKAVIFKSPCAAIVKPEGLCVIDQERCVQCRECIREIGCPALVMDGDAVRIAPSLCTGCGLCTQVCSVGAIERKAGR